MHGEDLVLPGTAGREALAHQVVALVDQLAVPAAAVLLVQRDELAAGDPRRTPRLDEQHEREQSGDLRDVGQQLPQDPAEPDGLGGELLADRRGVGGGGQVALVEDEVDDGQHRGQPRRQVLGRRDPVGDLGEADLLLGPGDPLGHGRLRHQERLGDLGDGEAAEQPQGERHPRLRGEGRVAAGEDQPQPVVLEQAGRLVRCVVGDHQGRLVLGVAVGLAADLVDGAVAGRRGQPAAGVGRDAVDGPLLDRGEERLGGRVLGDVDAAEATDERGDDPAVLLAVDPLDRLLRVHRVGGGHALRCRPGTGGPRPCPRRPWSPPWPTPARRPGRAGRRSRSPRPTPWPRRTARR